MPLRASIAGETIIAPFLSDEEWQALKSRVKQDKLDVLLPCCEQHGYLRTSSRGLAHFVHRHKSYNCTSKSETWQHLKAKAEIIRACSEAGWEAITESSGDGWRADVLAKRGSVQIAFEVQWSSQTLEETELRQQRYKKAGIRCCWLFKTPPNGFKSRADIPLFQLDITDEACNVVFNPSEYDRWGYENRIFELRLFIRMLLSGNFRFSSDLVAMRKQEILIQFIQIDCWRCKKPYDIYYPSTIVSSCGEEIDTDLFFHKKVIAGALNFVESPEGKHIQMGYIKERYSKTVSSSYLSFGCAHCDALCGDFFLRQEIMPDIDSYPVRAVHKFMLDLQEPISYPSPHWCYSEVNQFCSGQYTSKS
ncbi:MAG: competence protein CoiA [Phototrophicaceae bacterium]